MSSTVPTTSVRSASSPGLRRNASRELGPIWVKSLIPGFAARISYSTACGPVVTNFGFMKPCVSGIAICKKCPSIVWEDPRLWAASGQQHKCNLWNIPDSQALGGKILDCLFVFGEGSVHRLQGWENQKKLEENQKNQKNQKNQSLGRNAIPKDFLQGIGFFGFFGYFGFFGGKRLQGWEKPKKLEENQKNQKKQKNQSLGRNAIPKDFLQGIVFFGFFGYFGFFRHFFPFRFMILWGVCRT